MAKVQFPYGRENLEIDIAEDRLQSILVSKMHDYDPRKSESDLVREALQIADAYLMEKGIENGSIIAIPDGVSVISSSK